MPSGMFNGLFIYCICAWQVTDLIGTFHLVIRGLVYLDTLWYVRPEFPSISNSIILLKAQRQLRQRWQLSQRLKSQRLKSQRLSVSSKMIPLPRSRIQSSRLLANQLSVLLQEEKTRSPFNYNTLLSPSPPPMSTCSLPAANLAHPRPDFSRETHSA